MGLILRRLPAIVATLLIVSFLTFLLTSLLPGDPAVQILGPEAANDPESLAAVREDLRLDDPLLNRYGAWLGDVTSGDLGRSYRTGQSVSEAIAERLPVTLEVGASRVQLVGASPRAYMAGWARPADLADPAVALRILLCHFPNVVDQLLPESFQLVLAGHHHGGQICLPAPGRRIPLAHPRARYPDGVFELE